MKKQISMVLTTIAAAAVVMTGCGNSKDPAYLSGIKASEYVELADYSAIPVEVESYNINDEYVDLYVQYQLSMSSELAEVTDRDVVESGDIVNIDYEGKRDGVAFDGGTATGTNLTIGSGQFIDGFEDGLIGVKVGETVDLDLTFPEAYSNEELAGAEVVFTVTVNSIQEYQTPELTDEWVASQYIDGVETADDFREYVRENLEEQAQASYDSEVQDAVVTYLEENSNFLQDPPTEMVDRFTEAYTDTLTSYAQQYGTDLVTFMTQIQGSTEETYEDDIRDLAFDTAKEYIILQAVADAEDLNVSKKDYNTAASTQAASLGYSSVKDFEDGEDEEAYREYLMVQNVLEFLNDKAVVTEPSDSEETAE